MTTRKDVARLAGVSVATVSYVINRTKRVTPEVERRVRRAVEELNYRPNLLARGLTNRKTRHVAMLVDNLQNPHYTELLSGAQSVASENGYIVSIIPVDVSQPKDILELTSRGVEGVILTLGAYHLPAGRLLDDALPKSQADEYVKFDYDRALDDMLAHLISLGHRKIAALTGVSAEMDGRERIQAWRNALERHGLEVSEARICRSCAPARMDDEEGAREMNAFLDSGEPFTAVYAMNDLMAIGAMRALKMRGLRVPEDVSVVGNDHLEVLRSVTPSLASLDLHAHEMGGCLMRQLMEAVEQKPRSRMCIQAEYVPGESVGPVRKMSL